jgi:hypothetical protein
MVATAEFAFAFSLERFQRAVARPIRYGETGWARLLLGVLKTFRQVFERHTEVFESSSGLLRQVDDPSLLPFVPEAALARQCRQEHCEIGSELASLQQQLEAVLAPATASPATRTWADGRTERDETTFRALLELARRARTVGAAIEHHLLVEQALANSLIHAPAGPRLGSRREDGRSTPPGEE